MTRMNFKDESCRPYYYVYSNEVLHLISYTVGLELQYEYVFIS